MGKSNTEIEVRTFFRCLFFTSPLAGLLGGMIMMGMSNNGDVDVGIGIATFGVVWLILTLILFAVQER